MNRPGGFIENEPPSRPGPPEPFTLKDGHWEDMDLSGDKAGDLLLINATLSRLRLAGRVVPGFKLLSSRLASCNLAQACLPQSVWEHGILENCDAKEAAMRHSHWLDCELSGCNFQNALLDGMQAHNTLFQNTEFTGASWRQARLIHCRFITNNYLGRPDLRRGDFSQSLWLGTDLSDADVTDADFTEALFYDCQLRGVNWDKARTAGALFLETPQAAAPAPEPALEFDRCPNFAALLELLMRQYRFPELRRFRVEAGKVFLMFHDREVEIKPQMHSLGAPNAVKEADARPASPQPEDSPSQADHGRFRNLEL